MGRRTVPAVVLALVVVLAGGCQTARYQRPEGDYRVERELYEIPAGLVGGCIAGALALATLPLALAHPWVWADYWGDEWSKLLVLLDPSRNYDFNWPEDEVLP